MPYILSIRHRKKGKLDIGIPIKSSQFKENIITEIVKHLPSLVDRDMEETVIRINHNKR